MVMPALNGPALQGRLSKLDGLRQLAFGASCCERLLPNYTAFQRDAGWGDIAPVRKALDLVWIHLDGVATSDQQVTDAAAYCESAAPSSEDSDSLYVASAQDACFAVCSLLDFLLDGNVEKIVQAATYATDSVDLYVQEIENFAPDDPQLEQKILMHRLMQRELAKQEEDLGILELDYPINHDRVARLRASWNNDGRSNLDLP